MNTNIISAVSLVSLASFAIGCANASAIDNMPSEASVVVAQGIESGKTVKAPAAHSKQNAPTQSILFPRESTPFGVSYEDWAAAWWQWSLAIPKGTNPMLGGACDQNQSGNVFFLAGTMGGADTRNCTIPAGKGIYFPIVNLVIFDCPEYAGGEGYTCADSVSEDLKRQWANQNFELPETTLILEVDGVAVNNLEDYRAQSDSFVDPQGAIAEDRINPYCGGPIRENSCGIPVGSPRNALADGYWAMLRPLPPGQHEVRFAASLDFGNGGFSLDVTYHLTIAP